MSRLLLEIVPEHSASNGAAADLPPIVICSRNGQEAMVADAFAGGERPLILRVGEQGYALEQPRASGASNLGIGEWHAAEGWKLRVTQAAAPESNLSLAADNPSWAAPELRITTYDGDRVKRLRCMLPVDEGSQHVVGRGGGQADLIVEDEHVSRTHLRFFVKDGKQHVEDMGSRWGTKLNGQPLTDAQVLKHGDEIRIGKSTINYLCYWDILPQSDASLAALRAEAADDLQAMPTDANANQSAAAAKDGPAPKAAPPKPAPADKKPEAPNAEKKAQAAPIPEKAPEPPAPAVAPEPDKPPTPTKPQAAKPAPPKRNIWGLDIGGAIIIVLLLLAGIAYLAYLVFKH
jgi:hypothetical protein